MRAVLTVSTLLGALLLSACATAPVGRTVLPSEPRADYQLGGAYEPAESVNIVVRDRTAPAPDVDLPICYLNGFQTQPGEQDEWDSDLLLRDDAGEPVADPAWPDEYLLDISDADRRSRIAERLAPEIAGCAASGFRAVEFDNLDSYTRSNGRLSADNAVDLADRLGALAHKSDLFAGQKNAPDLAKQLRAEAGFDFAIAEECAQFSECTAYTEVYGGEVIDVEYTDAQRVPFADFCQDATRPHAVVLRDRDLSPQEAPEYTAQWCAEERPDPPLELMTSPPAN